MTAPFDWDRLAQKIFDMVYEDMDEAAAAYLRERIEAAFVPVEDYRQLERLHDGLQDVAQGLTARAEAAEARVKVLEEQWQDLKRTNTKNCLFYTAHAEAAEARVEVLEEALRQITDGNRVAMNDGTVIPHAPIRGREAQRIARKALGGVHE